MNYIGNGKDYLNYYNYIKDQGLIDLNKDKEYWGNVLISSPYLKSLYDIFKKGMLFLDLGSGTGNVLRFANNIGYNVTGVEFNKNLIEYSKEYLTLNKDIRNIDPYVYNYYDVIYSYKPLKEEFEDFINKVIENMKVGAYIVTPDFKINNNKVTEIDKYTYKR